MDMDKSEVLSLALLAAKTGGTGGTGWTAGQIRMLESILGAVTYTNQDAQDTADALIVSLLASAGGSDAPGTDDPGTDDPGTDDPGTDTPGSDDPGTDAPGTDDPNDPDDPDVPAADACTSASGTVSKNASTSALPTVTLTPSSGTAFAQEPNKLTVQYVSGTIPSGYKLYSAVLTRSGSTWTVADIRNGTNASNFNPGNTAAVSWGTGWLSVDISGVKANLVTTNEEKTLSFGGSSSDPTVYTVTAEVV